MTATPHSVREGVPRVGVRPHGSDGPGEGREASSPRLAEEVAQAPRAWEERVGRPYLTLQTTLGLLPAG